MWTPSPTPSISLRILGFPLGSKGVCMWSLFTYKRDLSANHTLSRLSPTAYCYPVLIGVWNAPPSLCTAVYGRNSILHVYQIWSHLGSRSMLFKSPALGTESSSFQDHVSITNCYKHSETELTSVFWDVSVFILKNCGFWVKRKILRQHNQGRRERPWLSSRDFTSSYLCHWELIYWFSNMGFISSYLSCNKMSQSVS